MSLRAEIHEAFDELEPRNVGLEERVIANVASPARTTRRRSFQLRAPLSLVAVVLVIAVIAGALAGGRLLADWKRFTAPPVPAAPQTPLSKLEARAIHMPKIDVPGHCPDGPYDENGDYGAGQMHTSGSTASPQTAWGTYFHIALWADGPVREPILMRGQDLITHTRTVFIGQYASGPVIGTDTVDGQLVDQHLEMVIQTVAPPYAWQIEAGVRNDTQCWGWQIDTPDFSEAFVIN